MSCSSDDQSNKECPLCMEPLEIDDLNFYPCKCEYQICRFCWHRLRTDENGLCPACRQPYPEDPVNFKPLSTADLQKMKSEKKLKQQAERQRISESRKHLSSYRVLQKNLVYVIGLSSRVADPEVLRRPEYFGKYGKICKVAVGTTTSGVTGCSSSHTAYVTYSKVEEALRAIQGVSNALLDGRLVKASLGTTKYCSSFLRSQQCFKPECMYLHELADSDISFTKDDMHAGKHAEYEKKLMDNLSRSATQVPSTCVNHPLNDQLCLQHPLKSVVLNRVTKELNGTETKKEDELLNKGRSRGKEESKGNGKERSVDAGAIELDRGVNAEWSACPPDDWASRDDGPSSSPPGLPHPSLPSTLTPPSDSSNSPLRPNGSAPEWQALLGLNPQPSTPPSAFFSDDDLGFDPFHESSRELAALVEEEKRKKESSHPPVTSRPPGFGGVSLLEPWRDGVGVSPLGHSLPSHGLDSSPLDTFSFHPLSSHPISRLSPFDLFHPREGMDPSLSSSLFTPPPPGLLPPTMSHPPPGLPPPRSTTHSLSYAPPTPRPPTSLSEWQEGLKALLPNVNVRFASDLEREDSSYLVG